MGSWSVRELTASLSKLGRLVRRVLPTAAYRSTSQNVYHCCVHKTGSQWVRAVLSDEALSAYCGLKPYSYQQDLPGGVDVREIRARTFSRPFPPGTIATPIYIGYQNYLGIPKPSRYRSFFVMRDPRDIVVSWYFSMKHSHAPNPGVLQHRDVLAGRSVRDGLEYATEHLDRGGSFAALRSWVEARGTDEHILIVRFEDLIGVDATETFARVLAHCDIRVPEAVLRACVARHSFGRVSGRDPGVEDPAAHYRKGIAGDWKNHFDERLAAWFDERTDHLVARLGYE